jgi:transposase-like protein
MTFNSKWLHNEVLCTPARTIEFLRDKKLIRSSWRCDACGCDGSQILDSSTSDGIIWRCPKCRAKKSIRYSSWFGQSRLSLSSLLLGIYHWVYKTSQEHTALECEFGSNNTTVNLYMQCRQVCYEILEKENYMLGGEGIEVEIDEAKLGKRKYNKGKRVEGQWIFGILERNSSNCCIIPVNSRDEETLIDAIQMFIRPGTTIYSDCWKSYSRLNSLGYIHLTVNHSKNFKDKSTGAHTNGIEGTWNLFRRSLPKFGTTKSMYSGYMIEFMFRRRFLNNVPYHNRFIKFLDLLSNLNDNW